MRIRNRTALTRREFLTRSMMAAGAVALPYCVPAAALGRNGTVTPSDRIVMGGIGLGGRGSSDLEWTLNESDVQWVAVCDVRKGQRQAAKNAVDAKYGNTDCVAYADMRQLLAERADVDAVLIATGDRWHSLASVLAMRAGKDVYCEKPACLTMAQGQMVVETARRYGRIFQTEPRPAAQRALERYKEIKNKIIQDISMLSKNEKLPTIRDLMKRFNTSQVTIDKAIFELKSEGVISTHVGRGMFINKSGNHISALQHKIICFIISDPTVLYESIILSEALKVLHDHGYYVMTFATKAYDYKDYALIKNVADDDNVQGWIIFPDMYTMYDPEFHNLVDKHISKTRPFISIDFPIKNHSANLISVNNYLSGKQLGNEVLKDFTGKIGFIWIPESNTCQQRMNGLMSANREASYDLYFIPYSEAPNKISQQEIFNAYDSGVRTFLIATPALVNSFIKIYYNGILTGKFSGENDIKVIMYIEPSQNQIIPDNFIKVCKPSRKIGAYAAETILKIINGENVNMAQQFECEIDYPK